MDGKRRQDAENIPSVRSPETWAGGVLAQRNESEWVEACNQGIARFDSGSKNQSLARASPLKKDITSGLPVNWEILISAEDWRSLALVRRDCILQVFPRLFPSGRPHPAVR